MGTTVVRHLSAEEVENLQEQRLAMIRAADGNRGIADDKFVFFAGLDGTNNDKRNLEISGSPLQTNVANLYDQVFSASQSSSNVVARYYPGIGTGGEAGNILNAGIAPTTPAVYTAEKAYAEFSVEAVRFLNTQPGATPNDIVLSIADFSRGNASALKLAWLVNDRGLLAPDGTVLAPPGSIKVTGMVMMDPVHRFIDGEVIDASLPPNVVGPVLMVRALDELRADFRVQDYGNDPRVVIVDSPGNHCDSGGGNDRNGLGALNLEGMTGYLQAMGVPIADVPAERRFDSSQPVAVHSEAYQTAANGDVVVNVETGESVLKWQMDSGPRRSVPVKLPVETHDPSDPRSVDAVNGSDLESDQNYANRLEIGRLLNRAPAPVSDGTADSVVPAWDNGSEITRLLNRSRANQPAPASEPSAWLEADPEAVQAIVNWGPTLGEAGPAIAAGEGGIVTDGGLQRPGGLPPPPLPTVDTHDPTDASSRDAVNGSDLQSDQAMQRRPERDNGTQLQGDLGLASSLLHWDQQGDLGHVQTALSLYNRLNSGGSAPNLGGIAAGLGLISSTLSLADALQSGDAKAIIGAGASFGSSAIQVYSIVEKAPLSVGGTSTALGQAAGVLGVVGGAIALSDALEHGNALQIAGAAASTASGVLMMAGAACPPLAIAGAFFSLVGGLWHDDPEPKGDTVLSVNSLGQLGPALVQDQDGGGDTALQAAHGAVEALAKMVQASNQTFTAQGHDAQTYGWGLNPFALEGLHIGYDSTLGNGFTLTTPEMSMAALTWQGLMEQVSDYAQRHDAIIPAWQSDTLQGHWQLAQGDPALQAVVREGADHLAPLTAEERGDHLERALQTLSTEVPPGLLARLQAAAPNAHDDQTLLHMALGSAGYTNERVFDVDGDGLQKRSAWVAPRRRRAGAEPEPGRARPKKFARFGDNGRQLSGRLETNRLGRVRPITNNSYHTAKQKQAFICACVGTSTEYALTGPEDKNHSKHRDRCDFGKNSHQLPSICQALLF